MVRPRPALRAACSSKWRARRRSWPLDRFRRQHGINEVGEFRGNLTSRDAQRFAVSDGDCWFVISGNVEGWRRSSEVFGIDQAEGEDVGGTFRVHWQGTPTSWM